MSGEIVKQEPRAIAAPLTFTSTQRQIILDTYANGATEEEFAALLEIAGARNLDPRLRQVWFVKRWDSQRRREVWACQVSIDGLRAIAERTGLYDGQDETEFEHDAQGNLISARATVYRRDWSRPCSVRVYLEEFIQRTKEKQPTQFWAKSPRMMLAKCAETAALRKAFSEVLSGLSVPEDVQDEAPASTAPVVDRRAAAKSKAKASEPDHDVVTGEVVEQAAPALAAGAPPMVDQIAAALNEAQTKADLTRVGQRIKMEPDLTEDDKGYLRKIYSARGKEVAQ